MAIDPASDIVLEVARAADPQRAAAVAQRLATLASDAPPTSTNFAATLEKARPASADDMRVRIGSPSDAASARANKAKVQFEAVLLNSFVSEMLPKDTPDAFGHGMSGEMGRSPLAEKISKQMAASGALGLGERLFATHPLTSTARLAHETRAMRGNVAAATQMSGNELSLGGGAHVVDGAVLFADAQKS